MLDLPKLENRIRELSVEAEKAAVQHHTIMGAINELRMLHADAVNSLSTTPAVDDVKKKK